MDMLSLEGVTTKRWNQPPSFDFAKVQEWLKLRYPKYPEMVWIIKADMPWTNEQIDHEIPLLSGDKGQRHKHRIIGQDWEFVLKIYTPSVVIDGIYWIGRRWYHKRKLDYNDAHVEEMTFQHTHEYCLF